MPDRPAPEDQSPSLTDDVNDIPPHELASHPRLLSAIKRNQSIPADSFCNIPEATVFLETGDHPPVYRRLFRIPHQVKPIVDEQVREWLHNGKVADAPTGCLWKLPLLVALK